MAKQNNLWRLDLLECHYLPDQHPPRYSRTKLLLKSKKKPANLLPNNRTQALEEIDSLRSDIFNKKLHSSIVKYKRTLKKLIKTNQNNKKLDKDELNFIKNLNIDQITNIKIIKLIQSVFKIIPKKTILEPNTKLKCIPDWIYQGLVDKTNQYNQSFFYNGLTQLEKNYYSKLMNNKELVSIIKIIENSLKIVLGPVENKEVKKDIEDVSTEESESEEEENEDNENSEDEESEDEKVDDDKAEEEDDYSQYDALVAGSEDEESEVEMDQNINYNEGKKELNLPELATGYFSGGSDSEDDHENDKVVKNLLKPQKKNRRGQRARQKIWEAKFKNNANHIKKEKEEQYKERQQRQKEYEERVAKRAAKAKELEITGSNNIPLKERGSSKEAEQDHKLHPSWEAKKKQEEAQKNIKFSGKKIKF
ncbi:hypothetical protein WICANDRAFT_85282 [Wickerhamomyces anomalus NRRL Y-366-8]|uniref:Bud22 domain-containing protein n=1 Tax=Wickerhamomyces anomalus (strain ATCC 58044 / CBS 1984 / NCYC 433 / NRRL Y-366-8) TaxID=683960 RepID=A0A1E3NYI5_WICAA|nr:uncharacterized protein WICANDRAFT_85282 [Wickerhamomyces anomalus NRRL Y-366-8]ODQ58183.1 hypothetical protein WICANDRAFT_85282 [Wickerhamomyces anomalus NRRL Y-366-8]